MVAALQYSKIPTRPARQNCGKFVMVGIKTSVVALFFLCLGLYFEHYLAMIARV